MSAEANVDTTRPTTSTNVNFQPDSNKIRGGGGGGANAFLTKLLVNRKRQEGNPLLKYVRNVPYEWSADIRADYECSRNCGVLYLSLKYHKLHPGYIDTRLSHIRNYELKILLVLVNVEEPATLLRDLNLYCYRLACTPVLCYSVEEAAEYLESFKLSEKRSPETAISNYQRYCQQRQLEAAGQPAVTIAAPTASAHNRQLFEQTVKFLASIRSVSQADAKRLLGHFGSVRSVSRASTEDLELCPGLGPIKAQNVFNFFRAPFLLK